MLAAFRGLPRILLIFSLVLNTTFGAKTGCGDYDFNGDDGVCCKKCNPGNRLVERCGNNPEKLCTPCEPGTYVNAVLNPYCLRCTQCIGIQFEKIPCTASSDAVCGCKDGYRCGNEKCSYCVDECKLGEEPTRNRSCRKCPEGQFNDKIHSMCKERRKSCPHGQTLVEGNATSDSTCTDLKEAKPDPDLTIQREEREQIKWLPVLIAVVIAVLAVLAITAFIVAYVKAQNTTKKAKIDILDQDHSDSDDSRIMVVEQEDCSFRHPEQEQGGSSDSINTQDSETKLIV